MSKVWESFEKFFSWLFNHGQDLLKLAMTIASIIDKFGSSPPSSGEKREHLYGIFQFIQHSTIEQLEAIVEMKRDRVLDGLSHAEVDGVIGLALKHYIEVGGEFETDEMLF